MVDLESEWSNWQGTARFNLADQYPVLDICLSLSNIVNGASKALLFVKLEGVIESSLLLHNPLVRFKIFKEYSLESQAIVCKVECVIVKQVEFLDYSVWFKVEYVSLLDPTGPFLSVPDHGVLVILTRCVIKVDNNERVCILEALFLRLGHKHNIRQISFFNLLNPIDLIIIFVHLVILALDLVFDFHQCWIG